MRILLSLLSALSLVIGTSGCGGNCSTLDCSGYTVRFDPPLASGEQVSELEVVQDGVASHCLATNPSSCDKNSLFVDFTTEGGAISAVGSFDKPKHITVRALKAQTVVLEQSFKPVYEECDQCRGECCGAVLSFPTNGS